MALWWLELTASCAEFLLLILTGAPVWYKLAVAAPVFAGTVFLVEASGEVPFLLTGFLVVL